MTNAIGTEEEQNEIFEKAEAEAEQLIEEEMAKKKFLFQIVCHEDGRRCEPFVTNWDGLKRSLEIGKEKEAISGKDWVLLVAILQGEQTHVPGTPLITVDTYLGANIGAEDQRTLEDQERSEPGAEAPEETSSTA